MDAANIRNVRLMVGGLILCTIDLDGEAVDYLAHESDQAPVCQWIVEEVAAGRFAGEAIAYEPPQPPAPTLTDYAAQARFAKETGGVTLNGAQIDTDRKSQAMISGAFNYVREKPSATIQFKTAAGFVALDAATVESTALAVGDHVQACFAKEAEVLAAIVAGTITKQSEIDQAFAAI